jgi:hypothetical protein
MTVQTPPDSWRLLAEWLPILAPEQWQGGEVFERPNKRLNRVSREPDKVMDPTMRGAAGRRPVFPGGSGCWLDGDLVPEDGCHRCHVQVEHGALAAYAVCDLSPQSRVLRQRRAYHQILVGGDAIGPPWRVTGCSGTLKRSRRRSPRSVPGASWVPSSALSAHRSGTAPRP